MSAGEKRTREGEDVDVESGPVEKRKKREELEIPEESIIVDRKDVNKYAEEFYKDLRSQSIAANHLKYMVGDYARKLEDEYNFYQLISFLSRDDMNGDYHSVIAPCKYYVRPDHYATMESTMTVIAALKVDEDMRCSCAEELTFCDHSADFCWMGCYQIDESSTLAEVKRFSQRDPRLAWVRKKVTRIYLKEKLDKMKHVDPSMSLSEFLKIKDKVKFEYIEGIGDMTNDDPDFSKVTEKNFVKHFDDKDNVSYFYDLEDPDLPCALIPLHVILEHAYYPVTREKETKEKENAKETKENT